MEHYNETPTGDGGPDIYVNIGQERYKIIIDIEFSKLLVKLESEIKDPETIYQNHFQLPEIQNLCLFFSAFQTLEIARQQISNIIATSEKKVLINENNISLDITMFGQKISFPLIKLEKNNEFYNSLSSEMKEIVKNNEIIVGIDLGTTYSCASVMLDNEIIVIENSLGLRTTPSYVCFLEHNRICVGELAKLQPSYAYKNTIYNTKRFLGRNINDKEIKEIIPDLPFKISQDKNLNQLKMSINFTNYGNNPKEFYPEQISALILKKLVSDSEYYLKKKLNRDIKIQNAVITVPAYFNQKQREATMQAAEIINLNVKRMINEPTAASLAYGYNSPQVNNKLITVLDFGGGTLDLTLLKFIQNDKNIYYDVKFSFGNTHFGGEDFDYILMKKCLESIGKDKFDKNLQCNIRLKRACEIAKIKLSYSESTNIILEEYDKGVNINLSLTREDFETYCDSLFRQFEDILNTFLKDCGHKEEDISEVILIGGSTYIPKVQTIIQEVFKHSLIQKDIDPKEAVAKGAAIQAAMLSKISSVKNINLLDVTNLSFGVKEAGYNMAKIIKRSTPIPEEITKRFQTAGDNQTEALIEIYEGEDAVADNNLCLDKFTIYNLPKMKAGKAKIDIKIFINNDSILKVTAYDMQNKDNIKELEIKRPKGLRDKIGELQSKTKEIKEIDLDEYIKIKDFIIDLEEEIEKSNDSEQLQESNSKLINILSEFVMEIIYKLEQKKLAISYIKYYFLKVMKYLEEYQDNKVVENFNKNLNYILDEIQYVNTELIFEIIEIFVDNKEIYSKCIFQLLDRYYEKIANDFYQVNVLLHKQPNNFEEAFKKLEDLKKIIELAQRFFDIQVSADTKRDLTILINKIKDFKLIIEVKEVLIRNRQNTIDFSDPKEKEKMEKILEDFSLCKSKDIKDLMELEKMIKRSNEVINEEEKRAINFMEVFEKMEDDDFEKFYYIFDKFEKAKYEYTDLRVKIDDSKQRYNFILLLCGKYQNLSNNTTPGPKKDAIDKIHVYLNHLKKKCEDNTPLFKDKYV